MAGARSYGILISKLKNWKIRKLKRVCIKDGARRTKDEQKTNKRRTMNEQKTNNERTKDGARRTKDEQKTNNERTMTEQ